MTVNGKISIKDKIAKKIYKLSESTKRNASYHVNKALENYFDDIEDLNEAVSRLKNKNDRIISPKELRKSLGI